MSLLRRYLSNVGEILKYPLVFGLLGCVLIVLWALLLAPTIFWTATTPISGLAGLSFSQAGIQLLWAFLVVVLGGAALMTAAEPSGGDGR